MPTVAVAREASALQSAASQVLRPARALLGWLAHDQAILLQNRQRQDNVPPEFGTTAEAARAAVAARPAGISQEGLIADVGSELQEHVRALRASPVSAPYFSQGWRVALVDLRKVCAAQPTVFLDHAEQRTAAAVAGDFRSLANITLPLPSNSELPAQFEQGSQTWILRSPNLNLRIVGNWAGPAQPGLIAFGFAVTLLPSYLQVARFRDRYLLRDGYHRACALLRRGISLVPALVRDFGPLEDLGLPPGLLAPAAYLGERPPLLPDFGDNSVSKEVLLPATEKMILIHGMELAAMT